jgi:hypothetical protein
MQQTSEREGITMGLLLLRGTEKRSHLSKKYLSKSGTIGGSEGAIKPGVDE